MKDYKITNEEINQVIMHSPYSLGDTPTTEGLKAVHIKKYFYDFIRVLAEKLNVHLSELTEVLSTYDGVCSDAKNNKERIEEILNKLLDLDTKDSELGTGIQNAVSIHNESALSHSDIRMQIGNEISVHDNSLIAHEDIREKLKHAIKKCELAYMVASGKNRAFPISDVADMIDIILSGEELRIGDVFMLAQGEVSDFTVFDTNVATPLEGDIELLPEGIASGEMDILCGKMYYYNKVRLLSAKKGLETSVLAKREELEELFSEMNEYITKNDGVISDINKALNIKQNKKEILENSAHSVDILNNTEYNLGLRATISLNLPTDIPADFEAYFNFRSGTTPTSLDAPDNLIFTGDDTLDGKLYPVSNRIYEVSIKSVGGYLIARVGCADYEVIQ